MLPGRRAPLVKVVVLSIVVAGCASPVPTPTLTTAPTASPAPTVARTSSPSASPSLTAPVTPTPPATPEPTFEPIPSDTPPPLVYDWAKFPEFPLPVLVSSRSSVKASAVAGCITRVYNPPDDGYGRSASDGPRCLAGPLVVRAPISVKAGQAFVIRAPVGYLLGAQVVDGESAYALGTARIYFEGESPPARIDDLGGMAGLELCRTEEFNLAEIECQVPAGTGMWLVAVQAQFGRADHVYREFGSTFLFWIRVVKP